MILLACALFSAEPEDRFGEVGGSRSWGDGPVSRRAVEGQGVVRHTGGHPLIVVGLCHSQMPEGETRFEWMRKAGFNTFTYGVPKGAEEAMNELGELLLVPGYIDGLQFPDLFDPAWRAEAAAKIGRLVPVMSGDKRIIGVYVARGDPLLFELRRWSGPAP